ncbi:hypothetical protein GpartN1_g870.t1 [Galdieria partita]|uniref:Uncharacterized protein n=1 Tax=Galdieria partita TaxID=83374 RepID=A0A9C7PRU3_9RHOD|nr:hypothetical protein GpartN1_g870.t1 [Galdieria partita]
MVHAALSCAPLDARFLVGGAIAACVPKPQQESLQLVPENLPPQSNKSQLSDADHARTFLQRILGPPALDLGTSSVEALIAQTLETIIGTEDAFLNEKKGLEDSTRSIAEKYAYCLKSYSDPDSLQEKTLGFRNNFLDDTQFSLKEEQSSWNEDDKRYQFVSLALFSCLEVEIRFSGGHYDSRSRAAFWRAAQVFSIDSGTLSSAEATLATILAAENEAAQALEHESFEETKRRRRKIRMMKIAAASTIGGFMVGFTGGVLAPAIIPALASVGMGMGLTSLSATTSSAVIGSLFGIAGASISAKKIRHLTANVSEFDFEACNRVSESRVRDMMQLIPLTIPKGGREEILIEVTVAGSMLGWELEGVCEFGIQYEPFRSSKDAISADAVALAVDRALIKAEGSTVDFDGITSNIPIENDASMKKGVDSNKLEDEKIKTSFLGTDWDYTKKLLNEVISFRNSTKQRQQEDKPGRKCWVLAMQSYPLSGKKEKPTNAFGISMSSLRVKRGSSRDTYLCAEPGVYSLLFDNSSAVLRNAYVKYRYAVIPPGTKFIPQWLTDKDEDENDTRVASNKDANDRSLKAPLSLHIIYFIPGWLVEEQCGYHWKGRPCWGAFACQFQSIAEELFPLSECFAVRWESVLLEDIGNALLGFLKSIAAGKLTKLAMDYVIPGLLGTVTMPLKLLSAASVFDNLWSTAVNRATSAGIAMAEHICNGTHGYRPITLVGYSLGARVIFQCLEELSKREMRGMIHHAVLIGAPCTADESRWRMASSVVAGRLLNVYSENDWILGLLHRTFSSVKQVAGLRKITCPGVENINVSTICPHFDGHGSYRKNLDPILRYIFSNDSSWNCTIEQESATYCSEQTETDT